MSFINVINITLLICMHNVCIVAAAGNPGGKAKRCLVMASPVVTGADTTVEEAPTPSCSTNTTLQQSESPSIPCCPGTSEMPLLSSVSSRMSPGEREMIYQELDNLRRERDEAQLKLELTEKKLLTSNLSANAVENDSEKCKMMTGLSWGVFLKLSIFLATFLPSNTSHIKGNMHPREQLFMTLVKLRHNISFDMLASLKGIPRSTAIGHFWRWVDLMYVNIGFMIRWQDRETIFKIIPPVFKSKFPRLTSIIDCFEIFVDAPRNLKARAQVWSNYKKHCTVKVFVSCTPLGSIYFLSTVWGGRASDVQIVRESGFISHVYHCPGDQVLADRGFTLREDFASQCGAILLTPAFTKGKKQLSAEEVETSRCISSVRIHIERLIGLLKNRYTILKGPLPMRMVQSIKSEANNAPLSSIDKIVQVCGSLINLGGSVVVKEK